MVTKQYLKFGITCGLVGMLLLNVASSVQSKPPLGIEQKSTPSNPTLQPAQPVQTLPVSAQVNINGQTILLEVARTPAEQSIGLMNRTDLAKNRGMLFVFSPPRPVSFWMKNTLIPLDMVFVSNGVVKYIGEQILPCQADPCPGYGPAPTTTIDGVIELTGGRAAELRLKIGDRVKVSKHSAKRLK